MFLDYKLDSSALKYSHHFFKVKDLLNPSHAYDSLPVRWSAKDGFHVDQVVWDKEVQKSDRILMFKKMMK